MANEDNLIWIDLEMTGLEVQRDHIIEIATIITDADLNILAEGPVMAIYQSDALLDSMDKWNTDHHTTSGLVDRVRASEYSEESAQAETLAFLNEWSNPKSSPMCGNSIHQDRRFLERYMPKLEAYFHYRHVDVSTLKVLAQRWAPTIAEGFQKESKHEALQDIRDSIDELKYYRDHFLRTL